MKGESPSNGQFLTPLCPPRPKHRIFTRTIVIFTMRTSGRFFVFLVFEEKMEKLRARKNLFFEKRNKRKKHETMKNHQTHQKEKREK